MNIYIKNNYKISQHIYKSCIYMYYYAQNALCSALYYFFNIK